MRCGHSAFVSDAILRRKSSVFALIETAAPGDLLFQTNVQFGLPRMWINAVLHQCVARQFCQSLAIQPHRVFALRIDRISNPVSIHPVVADLPRTPGTEIPALGKPVVCAGRIDDCDLGREIDLDFFLLNVACQSRRYARQSVDKRAQRQAGIVATKQKASCRK